MTNTWIARTLGAAAVLTVAAMLGLGGENARAAEGGPNACGCRQDAQGSCFCEKKSKCGCPGECEPKGCEERRAKQLEKEIQAETKKAEESSRRQSQSQSRGRSEEPSGASDDQAERTPAATSPKTKMTSAQKKELAKLLGLYLAEHPDQGDRSVEQVRSDVAPRAK